MTLLFKKSEYSESEDKMGFKEQTIFELEKNNPVRSSKKFKEYIKNKYGKDIDSKNLYIEIVNYQVKKYGATLDNFIEYDSGLERRKNRNKKYR